MVTDSKFAVEKVHVPNGNTRGRRVSGEGAHKVKWCVIHSAVCCDGAAYTSRNLAGYLESGAGGRPVSWHYNVDRAQVVQSLDERWMGRHTGSSYVDKASIAIEMAVNIADSEQEWLEKGSAYNETMERTAELAADICLRHGFEPEPLTLQQFRDGKPGIISHKLSGIAFKGSTSHTDPGGPNGTFPWGHFWKLTQRFAEEQRKPDAVITRDVPTEELRSSLTEMERVFLNIQPYSVIDGMFQTYYGRKGSKDEITMWLSKHNGWGIQVIFEIHDEIRDSQEAVKNR